MVVGLLKSAERKQIDNRFFDYSSVVSGAIAGEIVNSAKRVARAF